MKEILIVSNYYPPEKGAAANRIEQMALKLQQNGYAVKVVCPLGNYPYGKLFPEYQNKFAVTENQQGIIVKRLWIFPSNSGNFVKRILSIKSFSTMLFGYLMFAKLPPKVIVQSPPLLLSFIAVAVLSFRKRKIILNVSDLWPLAAVELKAVQSDTISHKILLQLEKYIYKNATVVLGQSNEIITHVRSIAPEKLCYLYRNFPDHQMVLPPPQSHQNIKIFYAGLLGVAQGILELCEKIHLPGAVQLHIFGDGAESRQIQDYIKANQQKNIFFHGMLTRSELLQTLTDYGIAVVPLRTRIFGSVPSKIFEYGALGFPILYFGGGEGGDIVQQNNLGWVVEVENYQALNNTLEEISNLSPDDILKIKLTVREKATVFNLDNQVKHLLEQNVF